MRAGGIWLRLPVTLYPSTGVPPVDVAVAHLIRERAAGAGAMLRYH